MSNFNINIEIEKAMKTIANSKVFRNWTYVVMVLVIIAIFVLKSGDLVASIADLIRAVDGR